MDEVRKDMNTMLTLLPICDFDQKKYILVHTTNSREKVNNLKEMSGSKLYLKYCSDDHEYSLLRDSEHGARSAVTLTKFREIIIDECVQISSSSPKQINLAGIDVFWSFTSVGHLKLHFYVNTDKLVDNFEDSVDALNQMCQNHVAPVVNKFLLLTKTQPFMMYGGFYKTYSLTNSSNHFQSFFDELEKLTGKWETSENYEIREDCLNFQLMKYQRKTVDWLIERELRSDRIDLSKILKCVPLVTPTSDNNNKSLYYFPILGLFTESNIFHEMSVPKGGILADEMGLGKTVEILSLIVSHRKDEQVRIVQNKPPTSKPKNSKSTRKQLNWPEYKAAKSGNRLGRSAVVYTVTPEELKTKMPGSCRNCENCNDMCDLEKSGWKTEFEKENVKFWCPRCMATKTPLEVKTTLIVLPESITVQWYNEISKHCSEDLKVMFYFGVNKNGYLHPLEIAKFDIILTTYSTLTNEIPYANFKNDSQPRLTRIRKFSPTSITHVKWWRLISDESQLVEGSMSRAAQMCTRLESHHRWCMTGTPIVKSISDLGGLFRIIGLWPLNVEHFWEIHVVAEFHEMANQNKDLSNSRLLQIAGQFMRRNTKKMVENELKIPKLVEIEKIVQFTKIEESQYKKEMVGLRKSVKDAIGNQEDEKSLNSMSGKEKVFQSLGKLKETLISCGEHANFSKRKNANEQVFSDPENVIFRLIRAKKDEINEYLKDAITSLLHIAEIRWIREEMTETAKRYDLAADVFLLIEELNKYFDEVMNLGVEISSEEEIDTDDEENIEPAKTESKSLEQSNNRKRDHEELNEKVPPRKIAKIELQEEEEDKVRLAAERKAKKSMMIMKLNAMRPITVNSLLMIRFAINIGVPFNSTEADETRKSVIKKMGEREEILISTIKVVERYWRVEYNNLIVAKLKKQNIYNAWEKKKEQHVGVKNVIMELEKSYKTAKSKNLTEKVMASEKTAPMLMEMSFWPVFKNSQQRFEDGKQKQTSPKVHRHGRVKPHNYETCMGICNTKSFEEISQKYVLSTTSGFLREIIEFIDKVEMLRKELLNDYSNLFKSFPLASPLDCLRLKDTDTLFCKHEKSENTVMCIDETSRNMEKVGTKCAICSVLHTLAHLRFSIGAGSFHGQAKRETTKTLESFFSMVFAIEKRKDKSFDGTKQLSDFVEYIERLRQTAIHIQTSCDAFINYNNRLKELYCSQHRTSMVQLRSIHKTKEEWTDDGLTAYFVDRYEHFYNGTYTRLTTACKELRYLINLYAKDRNKVSNTMNEEYDEDDNCCPICFLELEVVMHLPCGHRTCDQCYHKLKNRRINERLPQCVTCRKSFKDEDVIEARRNVVATMNREENVIPGMTLAVKMETTIRLMKEIIKNDPENNKILLFTTLEFGKPIWRFLTKVLQKAKLPFVEVTQNDYGKSVSEFESSAERKILLCSLPMCAHGLNLTQANHIVFLDPAHSFSMVEQAIGRINRYGQTQEIKVYHMIVEGSIDEELRKIVKAAKNNGKQQNEGKDLTVGELRQIFGINE